MITHRLLGILLHPRINGGIDLQTIGIEVIKLAIRPFVLVAPAEHRVGFPSQRVFTEFLSLPRGIITPFRFFGRQGQTQILPEIGSQAILMIQTGKTDGKRQGFQRVTFGLAQVTRLDHLLQDRIPTASCTFVLAYRIEIGRILAHTDQGCRLLDFQGFRGTAKIDTGCRLNTHRIVEEIKLVQIHVDDLLLRIVAFQLDGNDPFDGFLEKTLHHIVGTGREELLGQLLRDRTTATSTLLHQDASFDHGTHQTGKVDATVLGKADVLRCNQCLHQIGRQIFVVDIDTVIGTMCITTQGLAIGRDDLRSIFIDRIFQLFNGRHVTNRAIGNGHENAYYTTHYCDIQQPEKSDYTFCQF